MIDNYSICSFLKRDGVLYPYGEDAPLIGYSYFYTKLKDWIIEKMKTQKDFGPLEDIAQHLKDTNYPKEALISIGATAYEEFGENNYIQSKDEIFVVTYDNRYCKGDLEKCERKVILAQKVD